MFPKVKKWFLFLCLLGFAIFGGSPANGETIDDVYQKAKTEGGVLNCYCSLAQINAQKIFPMFEKRFPGIKINHVDATAEKLAVRAITESRGGRVIADVLEFGLENIVQVYDQGLVLEKLPPEAGRLPGQLERFLLDREQHDFLHWRMEHELGEKGR